MQDRKARHRQLLQDGLSRCAGGLEAGTGQLVREQLDDAEAAGYEAPALACLAAAEAVGSPAAAATAGAIAIALLAQMGLVFTSLENSSGSAGLSMAWGMPRSLNAGDALFALAQEMVLTAQSELTAAERLAAVSLVDRGGRELVEGLHAAGTDEETAVAGQKALLPAAFELGALLGGGDPAARKRLGLLGRNWATLPDEELSRKLTGDPAGWLTT